jgi:hypothetical protein
MAAAVALLTFFISAWIKAYGIKKVMLALAGTVTVIGLFTLAIFLITR